MTLLRCGLALALALGGACGCVSGGAQRASDIQNLNAIGDDIAKAVEICVRRCETLELERLKGDP